jgi:hypothetical protein
MKSGSMHMMPLDSQWYALMPTRIWYKPWRWDLIGVMTSPHLDAHNATIASNIRRKEIIGLMQIMGAYNIGD